MISLRSTILYSLFSILFLFVISAQASTLAQWSFLPPNNTEIALGPSSIIPAGENKIAFVYNLRLYLADGTPEGTRKVSDDQINLGIIVPGPFNLIFYSNGSYWKYYDPTNDFIFEIHNWDFGPLLSYSAWPLFSSDDKSFVAVAVPHYYHIYSYDPINGDFRLVHISLEYPSDVVLFNNQVVSGDSLNPPGEPFGFQNPTNLYSVPSLDSVFFSYGEPGADTGRELWRTDLTSYKLISDINPGPGSSDPRYFCFVPGVGLFFFANPTDDISLLSLYWSDGDSTVVRLHDFTVIPNNALPIVATKNRAVFIMITREEGYHLWSSDGTPEGTIDIKKIVDNQLVSNGDLAYFDTDSPESGLELYQSDGTVEGTKQTGPEPVPGPANSLPFNLSPINRNIYYDAYTTGGDIQIFKYTPDAPEAPQVLFSGETGWIEGGVQYNWGPSGLCATFEEEAPSSLPLSDYQLPESFETQQVINVEVNQDYFGCGRFFSDLLDFSGAKEVRFWYYSTNYAKVEIEVDGTQQTCDPFRPNDKQQECKPFVYLDSTQGTWKSVSIPLGDRPAAELQKVYSPFVITLLGTGVAKITSVTLVYF